MILLDRIKKKKKTATLNEWFNDWTKTKIHNLNSFHFAEFLKDANYSTVQSVVLCVIRSIQIL